MNWPSWNHKILPRHLAVGKTGEELAARYLHAKGWRIIERNFSCNVGEIDLIADDHGTLVFVEVRARGSEQHGGAEQSVDRKKERRIAAAAAEYLRGWRCRELQQRFDIVTVQHEPGQSKPVIRHFPAAF